MRENRSQPMPVKYWSFAGLMLTDWCNAECDSCYLGCGPGKTDWMATDEALRLWRELIDASPHGCRVHLTGGEPFGRWEQLIAICQAAREQGLGPLDKVETNAYWATDDGVIEDRLAALDDAGMDTLMVSADPYHQQYVPLAQVRRLVACARATLGPERVQVRWEDWLEHGRDTSDMPEAERAGLLADYVQAGRERLNGRAVTTLAHLVEAKPMTAFEGKGCHHPLLRSRHVHVFPGGWIMPGVCAGIMLGRATVDHSASAVWGALDATFADRPIVATLAAAGPVALAAMAKTHGYVPLAGYAGKCHLCWHVREYLFLRGLFLEELGPEGIY